jgi:two-component system, chemotaxis family, CheB/CheR fusion protein
MVGNGSSSGLAPEILVGVGASAVATAALEKFLAALGPEPGVATILVLQNREALDADSFSHRLRERGREVVGIVDGGAIEAGPIYLLPPNAILNVKNGVFACRTAQQAPGERGTIDSFLVSLAEDQNEKAVAVLLDGTGGDGTLGVAAIKETGGLALAEYTHAEEALASSNSPAALADFVLPPEDIAGRVLAYARDRRGRAPQPPLDPASPEVTAALASVAAVLRKKTGHDFHGYKANTFLRRVQRRMHITQRGTLAAYLDHLRGPGDEAQHLFQDLLIGVTQFFRDRKEFELLEREVIPRLFEGKGLTDQIRVWVLGCATGEEAYSIAILLRERMAQIDDVPQVQLFATDIDGRALAAARVGRYTEAIARDVTPERLARWFVKEGNTYCVVKELREMCIFAQHNVLRDAPFSRLDLVSCRNLLIYLGADLQTRVIPLFHFALRPGGFLFLGNAESVTRHTKLFTPIESRARIFRRIETEARVLPDFPFTAAERRVPEAPAPRVGASEPSLARRAERVAERYAPAYVITDSNFDVLHFSGRTGRFLDPAGGAATLNLVMLAHPDLRTDLRAALMRAAERNDKVEIERLPLGENALHLAVDVIIEPVQERPGAPRNFVVLFRDSGPLRSGPAAATPDESVLQLESELLQTRERLQASVEELESTNEELKSSNEEYQSVNEELQSANEELETSKEELQSVNEELSTVNGELAHRVQELGRANSDLKNLLESTQIATVFLDNQMRVMNYTPAVADVFHLVENDIGRPIAHIKSRIAYDELQEDVGRVQRTLAAVEREVESAATKSRYLVRVLPYRSTDNFIAGVVVTFADITAVTRAERALGQSEARLRFLADAGAALVGSRDYEEILRDIAELAVTSLGDFCLIDVVTDDETVRRVAWAHRDAAKGARLAALVPESRMSVRTHPFARVLTRDESVFLPEVDDAWMLRSAIDGEQLARMRELDFHSVVSVPLRARNRTVGAMTLAFSQTPARHSEADLETAQELARRAGIAVEQARQTEALKVTSERQKQLLAELQHRVRNTLAVVRSIALRTAETTTTVDDYITHFEGRLNAFARLQALLTRDPTSGMDLEYLLAEELLAHAAEEGEQVQLSGPALRLRPKAAENFALAIHELATNAVKYGALSAPKGAIHVTWKVENGAGDPNLIFDWRESGVKLDGNGPRRRGFGTELLERTLAYELGGETSLRFEPDGVRCTIRVPLTDRIIVPTPPASPARLDS